nr:methylated-DNA--protein-cysteine methyltransferase-like [Nerophis lumbriciformis]
MMKHLESAVYQSPIGGIELLFDQEKLVYLDFADNKSRLNQLMTRRFREFSKQPRSKPHSILRSLDRYFSGDSEDFRDVVCDTGGTEFQQSVWKQLRRIKRGGTLDYSTLATKAGNARAVRAAASSNARNPISIVIPCHRVIGKDGSLRGYAGGTDRKRFLLELEGAIPSLDQV